MKVINVLQNVGCFMIVGTLFLNCGTCKLDKESPMTINNPYYVKGTGIKQADFTVYLPADKSELTLNHIYFRGKKLPLMYDQQQSAYMATYTSLAKPDIIMSGDPKKEFGNSLPEMKEKTPFKLESNEAVIAYIKNGEEAYFKLNTLKEKKE